MKAVILERRGDYAAALCEDGTFVKTRQAGEVGETIELTAEIVAFPKKRRSRWMRGAVAAMLALALTGGTLGYMGGTASAYVSLDVDEDSAIELTVNHFGRVIAVDALDENTRELAESLSGEVRRHRAEDALNITMERLHDRGYLGAEGGAVIVGVATDDGRRAKELRGFAEHSAERFGEKPAYIFETSRSERTRAMDEHHSAGRFGFERDHKEPPVWGKGGLEPPRDGGRPEQGQPPQAPAPGSASAPHD
ncbi:MAG: hypothetical protein E7425_10845 [Ruminococcaceae bacterium]|nr:hypothetical protein [Oscillospiraceae bacterium]